MHGKKFADVCWNVSDFWIWREIISVCLSVFIHVNGYFSSFFSFSYSYLSPLPFSFFSFSSCPYDKVSHHIPDWSETHWVAQAGLKLMTIFLPQPPTYWEPRQESPCPVLNFILRITLVVVIVFWYYDWTQSLVYNRLILYQWTSTSPLVFLEGVCICLKDNVAVQIIVSLSKPFFKDLETATLMTESHCPNPLNVNNTYSLSGYRKSALPLMESVLGWILSTP